jgi:hypothetical protein
MLKVRTLLVTFSLLLFAVLVNAQAVPIASPPASSGSASDAGTVRIETKTGFMGGIIGSVFSSLPDAGQPFSADVLDETDKFLADGNHIHRETHGRIFRDSQGRTRTETETGNFGPENKPLVFVTIMDMVEGRWIHLDLENKTAVINHFPHSVLSPPASAANAPVRKPVQPLAAHAAASAEQAKNMALRKRLSEGLGTREIEGFTVSGTRTTMTTPAGQIGNDKPLITTSERWFSPDLKVDLLNSNESPESGKHVRKLVNIRTGDPDPLLFQVPSDFTIKETQQ